MQRFVSYNPIERRYLVLLALAILSLGLKFLPKSQPREGSLLHTPAAEAATLSREQPAAYQRFQGWYLTRVEPGLRLAQEDATALPAAAEEARSFLLALARAEGELPPGAFAAEVEACRGAILSAVRGAVREASERCLHGQPAPADAEALRRQWIEGELSMSFYDLDAQELASLDAALAACDRP
jgi:hypothetical protein